MTKSTSISSSTNYSKKRKAVYQKGRMSKKRGVTKGTSTTVAADISNRLRETSVGENDGQSHVSVSSVQDKNSGRMKTVRAQGEKANKKSKLHGKVSGAAPVEIEKSTVDRVTFTKKGNGAKPSPNKNNKSALSKLLENFPTENSTCSLAQIRATFYPKFENEKSDQEIRTRMIDMVSRGLATLEVSLKHSGSLFMYAGCEGGAYAKNSFGNIYTAVGVFVLGRTFEEAWGSQASKKQSKFNAYLERKRMCISMELVTAVLGDHGQRPREDYVVVTAVTELGKGKPEFYSTPDIIRFCRKWRLPTNHVWLFSTRKSVTSFFAAYDALYEEGTATTVCKALDELASLSIPGSKDHTEMQGEILEGLVARIVSHESSKRMKKILKNSSQHQPEGVGLDLGPSLREIFAANRSDEKKQIKALLQNVGTSFCPNFADWFGNGGTDAHSTDADESFLSKFLQANPSDLSTSKFQEIIRSMREKRIPAAFKCYYNFHKAELMSSDNLHFKMVIHIRNDSAFQRYQKQMRHKPGLWPLYRGFFVDVNLFNLNKERASQITINSVDMIDNVPNSNDISGKGGLADEDANLMIKMKFLKYKLRTFLIRNGLSILFKEGPDAYKTYCMRQMKRWNTSEAKRRELNQMLDEWACYARRKYGHKTLTRPTYLTEVEPFLEEYAKRSRQNQVLIGSAGNLVRADTDSWKDEAEEVETEKELSLSSSNSSVVKDTVRKDEGLIVFFPGIPGCGKSALCKEIISSSEGLKDGRPVHSLMADLTKGNYWMKVADGLTRKPYSIILADKNAPNIEVWRRIEEICSSTKAFAVPVVTDCEGTDTNPYSLDALAVFIYRVLLRANHPGSLDKACPTAGYVLLKFYHFYNGQDRREFETELIESFGTIVKMPLLEPDRSPLPESVSSVLEEGINLFKLHSIKHGRSDSRKGTYARQWVIWEKKLRQIIFKNAEYLKSIQVPLDSALKQVLKQLGTVAKGDYPRPRPSTEKRKSGSIIFAAVDIPVTELQGLLRNLAEKNSKVYAFLKDKNVDRTLKQAHLTLAHKQNHGVSAVANYASVLHQKVPVDVTALFFSDRLAALEAHPGSVDGEEVNSKSVWPHITLWTGKGAAAKESITLPQLFSEGKATRIKINPPVTVVGTIKFR
ncbi:putative 2',3'-cyclic-nucleotide 3'-phosphodiesterase [Heracleum sosnowskyi]|uniref:2',3'-cyclic-nucleotide 3'-phosphodiesterase n=1 Tax=Heracleum sosnowskyi TaxID=360622 RepID=A0AAD8HBZ9_9APIA|nr:putative 2',3'-cyclic-nucleotide 3'-phosphodiesterase [Heracleum sosnowskyi]